MILGRVVGNVVSTGKWKTLEGWKILIVDQVDESLSAIGNRFIALDTIGAGNGEIVMVIESREATIPFEDPNTPTDMAVVGIIERINCGGDHIEIM